MLDFLHRIFGFRRARKPKTKIWEIETNNNKTFNRWNLCNFFSSSLLKFIIYQQWRKKQLCSFWLNGNNEDPHGYQTMARFLNAHVKGENYRKVVLTRRMNKPIMIRASHLYYVAFSMLLFMHMQVIMLSKGAAKQSTTRECQTRARAHTQRYDNRFWRLHIFLVGNLRLIQSYIFCVRRSFQQFSHLIRPQWVKAKLTVWKDFSVSDSPIFISIEWRRRRRKNAREMKVPTNFKYFWYLTLFIEFLFVTSFYKFRRTICAVSPSPISWIEIINNIEFVHNK